MGGFEDTLSSILADPSAMAQIMSLAQSLGSPTKDDGVPPLPAPSSSPSPSAPDLTSLFSSFGDLDPQLIQQGLQLFSELSSSDDERAALLLALRPFLKEERHAKIDRAVHIARLSRVIRIAFQSFRGKGENIV